MTAFPINTALLSYGTANTATRDLDEIERAVYVLPTWTLRHPDNEGTEEITKHPSTYPTYLALKAAGWVDVNENEFSEIEGIEK